MKQLLKLCVLATTLLISTPAFAQDYCDPEAEPVSECACPTELDCTIASLNQLPSVDDISNIHSLANVEAEWNSTDNVWDVSLDVTGMPGEGIIVIPSDHGTYENVQGVLDVLSGLFGEEVTAVADENGKPTLPPMRVSQVGETIRLVDNNGVLSWASENSGSIIWDLLMTEDAKIQFDSSNFLDLGPIIECGENPGFSDSYDSGTVSDVPVAQCSGAGVVSADEECSSEENPFGGWPCIDGLKAASTRFGTNVYTLSLTRWSCAFDGTPGSCDSQPGQFRRVRKRIDDLRLQSLAFDNLSPVPVPSASSKSEVRHTIGDVNGVCSAGAASESGLTEALQTKAGLVNISENICSF